MIDMVSRQAAIGAINAQALTMYQNVKKGATDPKKEWFGGMAFACEIIKALPSAEPEKEKPRRVLWTGWKGYRDTRYRCPLCNKPVKNDDVYCHRCGQKLMFPKVDWTPYVEGQKQELIVRWDDETD